MSFYSATVLADSPAVYYRLGESSGTTMLDSSGNASNGTYTGSPTLGVAGALIDDPDTAASFNGTSQYGSAPSGMMGYQANRGTLSIECWFKLPGTTPGDSRIIWGWSKAVTVDNFITALVFDGLNGDIVGYVAANGVGGSATVSFGGDDPGGPWHHLVLTFDGPNQTIASYLDGVLISQQGTSQTSIGADGLTDVLRAGASSAVVVDGFLSGSLDELAIYPQVLSDDRILAHYNAGISPTEDVVGTANGIATASGVGASIFSGVGTANGIATANGVGVAIPPAGGASSSRNFFLNLGD